MLNSMRPVRFTKERDLGSVFPDDAQRGFGALSGVGAKDEKYAVWLRNQQVKRLPGGNVTVQESAKNKSADSFVGRILIVPVFLSTNHSFL